MPIAWTSWANWTTWQLVWLIDVESSFRATVISFFCFVNTAAKLAGNSIINCVKWSSCCGPPPPPPSPGPQTTSLSVAMSTLPRFCSACLFWQQTPNETQKPKARNAKCELRTTLVNSKIYYLLLINERILQLLIAIANQNSSYPKTSGKIKTKTHTQKKKGMQMPCKCL